MRKQKWLVRLLVLAVSLFVASAAFSRLLETSAVRSYLLARLTASFGRPVEVGQFSFSLLDGARFEARSLTVAEDPGFGNEYFLRAETLTAGLRWEALFSGRFEVGSLTLARPSLNLVRDAEGHWNIERWLPPAPSGASRPGFVGPVPNSATPAERLNRIDVDGGRINFKQGNDKVAFALLDVRGDVSQDSSGRWHVDLETRPMRAGVSLQDIGLLRLRGTIAGTRARLQPADLNLTWRAASLADALRLVWQQDFGVRGELSVDLNAHVGPPDASSSAIPVPGGAQWAITGAARLAGIHAWNLTGRATDPRVNFLLDAGWRSGDAHTELRKIQVEGPGSRVQGSGELNWESGFHPRLHLESSLVSLDDFLSWYRALHSGVADDLRAEGTLGVDVTLGGWPLQLEKGAIASAGGSLSAKGMAAPLQIGEINASVSRGGLDFAPTEFSFSPAASRELKGGPAATEEPEKFTVRGSLIPMSEVALFKTPNWTCSIEGATARTEDWLSLFDLVAQPVHPGWAASGGVTIKLRGTHRADSPAPQWLGSLDFQDFSLHPVYLNQPIHLTGARVDFSPGEEIITVSAAEALGASWRGTISRRLSPGTPEESGEEVVLPWTLDLTADQLDAAELDRWLGPRARPGFLARFAGFGSGSRTVPLPESAVPRVALGGRLRVGEIALGPMRFSQLDGELSLAQRTVTIQKAQANFFGGKISGALEARLIADPSYEFLGKYERVNLAQLARAVSFLNNRIGGTASGDLLLSAHGIGRESLVASLEGKGTLDARNPDLRGVDFRIALPSGGEAPVNSFASIQGAFEIHGRKIDLSRFVLDHSRGRLQAEGGIDFSHVLNIRIQPAPPSGKSAATSPSSVFLLNGTIENPTLIPPSQPAKAAARAGRSGK